MERKNNEKRTGRLSNLSEVFQLSKEGKTLFSNPSFRFWQLQNKWKNIAGPMIARESYISFEKKQTLYITVTNSVWMNHLYMMKAETTTGKSTQIYASLRAGRKSNAPRNPLLPL